MMGRTAGTRTVGGLVMALGVACAPVAMSAQWLKYPTPNAPRLPNGKVNLSAPAPRTADGKPDFTGIWITGNPACPNPDPDSHVCGVELPISQEGINMGVGLKGGLPYQPWLAALVKKRTAEDAKDDPHVKCLPDTFIRAYGLPHLLKFVQTPGLLVMLNEMNAGYRQVYMDGRPLPVDPVPNWQGYSTARWEGDALVVDSNGFRDDIWIDWNGSVITEAAKVRERIRRPDFGHLEIEVTVDDPKAYTKPWTVPLRMRFATDTDLVDEICLENEQSLRRMK
jgi:hypothetical protein